uniref:Uncharacterized protein n=1 Tax=Panagrolaimus sp. ES5 TaxID=591445 RepID=A0AC34G6X7_9BILA
MDSSLPQSSTSNAERKAENSLKFPTRTQFLKTYLRQSFSLPDSIMHYMAQNPPSPEVYEKLVKCCKYFFIKNQIIILSNTAYYNNEWRIYGNTGERINIDLSNISIKYWITGYLSVRRTNDNTIASSLISKIYKCNVRHLSLINQICSFDEFMVLASSNVEALRLFRVTVKYGDGTEVHLEKIVEQLPKVKSIDIYCPPNTSMITSKTMQELCKIPHFAKLDYFTLMDIPEAFNLESFSSYMKKNKITCVDLGFCDSISDGYKGRLEALVDEIIEADNREYKSPF